MTSPADPRSLEDDEAAAPTGPGPGPRWSGDGALAPRSAPRWGAPGDASAERPVQSSANPLAVAARQDTIDGMVLAAMWRRLLAWFIDRTIKAMVFLFIISISGRELTQSVWDSPDLIFASGLLTAGYEFVFGIRGVTPGARLVGIRIAALDGAEPGVRRSLLRASASSVNEFFLFAGSLVAFFDRRRQTVHDKIAGTIVVMTPPVEPDRPA